MPDAEQNVQVSGQLDCPPTQPSSSFYTTNSDYKTSTYSTWGNLTAGTCYDILSPSSSFFYTIDNCDSLQVELKLYNGSNCTGGGGVWVGNDTGTGCCKDSGHNDLFYIEPKSCKSLKSSSSKLSTGAIIGIAVAGGLLVLGVGVMLARGSSGGGSSFDGSSGGGPGLRPRGAREESDQMLRGTTSVELHMC